MQCVGNKTLYHVNTDILNDIAKQEREFPMSELGSYDAETKWFCYLFQVSICFIVLFLLNNLLSYPPFTCSLNITYRRLPNPNLKEPRIEKKREKFLTNLWANLRNIFKNWINHHHPCRLPLHKCRTINDCMCCVVQYPFIITVQLSADHLHYILFVQTFS